MKLESQGEGKELRIHFFRLFIFIFSLFLIPHTLGAAHAEKVSYTIQIGAFKKFQYALHEVSRLEKLGCNAAYSHETTENREKLYQVYIGSFGSRKEAEEEAGRLRELDVISSYYVKIFTGMETDTPTRESDDRESQHSESNISEGKGSISSHEGSIPPQKWQGVIEKQESGLVIEDILFKSEKGGKEVVFIYSDRYFWPSVLFSLRGESPRIVIHVEDTVISEKADVKISDQGELIKQIETKFYQESKTLEVVLNLCPHKNCEVTQNFNKAKNIYATEVVYKKAAPDTQDEQENEHSVQALGKVRNIGDAG